MKVRVGNPEGLEVDLELSTIHRHSPSCGAGVVYRPLVIYQRGKRVTGSVIVMAEGVRRRVRLELDLLDAENPFEIDDGNRVHLIKHLPSDDDGRPVAVGPQDVLDAYGVVRD